MKRPINQIPIISKSIKVLDNCEQSKLYGGGHDHGDNGGIPPDNDK